MSAKVPHVNVWLIEQRKVGKGLHTVDPHRRTRPALVLSVEEINNITYSLNLSQRTAPSSLSLHHPLGREGGREGGRDRKRQKERQSEREVNRRRVGEQRQKDREAVSFLDRKSVV